MTPPSTSETKKINIVLGDVIIGDESASEEIRAMLNDILLKDCPPTLWAELTEALSKGDHTRAAQVQGWIKAHIYFAILARAFAKVIP
jgi:hypothetical protein